MKIRFSASIISLLLAISSCEKDASINADENESLLERISHDPDFDLWYSFWNEVFPEKELMYLQFKKHKSESIRMVKMNTDSIINKIQYRNYTLDYSSDHRYVVDLYEHIVFEVFEDSIVVKGGSVDPAFALMNLKDSQYKYISLGTHAFFDECYWISKEVFVILGFDFWPSAVDESYCRILVIEGNMKTGTLEFFRSEDLPYCRECNSWTHYMRYKYPDFIR